MTDKHKNVKLTRISLGRDSVGYYISVIYEYEDERGFHELRVPRILLPIDENKFPNISVPDYSIGDRFSVMIDIGFGPAYIYKDTDKDTFIEDILVQEKIHRMTITEIENKLGYRIEIIE